MEPQVTFSQTVIKGKYAHVPIMVNDVEVGTLVKDRDKQSGEFVWFAVPTPEHISLFGVPEVMCGADLDAAKEQIRNTLRTQPSRSPSA